MFNIFPKKKTQETKSVVEETVKKTENIGEKPFTEGLVSTKDIIAPSAVEVDFNEIRINNKYYRTMFVAKYPRFVGMNWLSPLINFDASLMVSMYIYPTDGKQILDDLRRKIAEMEAEISTDIQRGRVVNPTTQAKLEDALTLQADLAKGEERFFQFGLYVTVSAETKEELNRISKNLEAALGALMINSKKATLQMEEGFLTTLPMAADKLNITRNMDTTSLATTFPFVSSDLSDDRGIMYGINEHNGSLVIFDRFSMPNYNSVVFATAGAGKSYMIKLEAMRSLMMGTEIMVIDPENEYRELAEAVGGQYIAFGYGEPSKINPFDLSLINEEGENALNVKILNLHKLFKIMIGSMDPIEESILDRAVMDAYKMKGITPDPETQSKEPPLIEDLYKSLIGMEEEKAKSLAARLEKYIKGSFAGIFNQKTNVNLNNQFVVFGIRNLEEALRPVAMQIILDYIWTVVKKSLKKRILVVDEAWYLMQYEDSASFLRGIVKRGRKYYLGVTTITQDVDDFVQTPYGKEIINNSSIQILLKQHSAAIDSLGEIFYLSEGEKQLLLAASKGEGIFFAGQNHVAIQVIASEEEHKLITSNPEEVMKLKAAKTSLAYQSSPLSTPTPTPNNTPPPAPALPAPPTAEISKLENSNTAGPNSPNPIQALKTPQGGDIDKQTENAGTPIINQPETTATEAEPVKEMANPEPTKVISGWKVETETKDETPTGKPTDDLETKIKKLEEEERAKLAEFEKNKTEEDKIKLEEENKKKQLFGGGGPIPHYADLFKSSGKLPPLPPLPPLPKYNPSTSSGQVPSTNSGQAPTTGSGQAPASGSGSALAKTTEDKQVPTAGATQAGEALPKTDNSNQAKPKPIFVNTTEVNVPQPPQLQKKPKPIFDPSTNSGQAPTTSSGQAPTTSSGQGLIAQQTESQGQAPPAPEATKNTQPLVKAETVTEIPKTEDESKTGGEPATSNNTATNPSKSYDELFGNGIV